MSQYVVSVSDCVFNKARVIDETPMVITAVSGSLAVLPCSVDPRYTEQYADQYKVNQRLTARAALTLACSHSDLFTDSLLCERNRITIYIWLVGPT